MLSTLLVRSLLIVFLLGVYSPGNCWPTSQTSGVNDTNTSNTGTLELGSDGLTAILTGPITFEINLQQTFHLTPKFPAALTAKFTYSPSRRGSTQNTAQLISLGGTALTPGPMPLELLADKGSRVVMREDPWRGGFPPERIELPSGAMADIQCVYMWLMLDGTGKRYAQLQLYNDKDHSVGQYRSPWPEAFIFGSRRNNVTGQQSVYDNRDYAS